jgi:predicted dehydrogenase
MTVKIGFIGAGGIAQHHIQTIVNHIPEAKIVTLFDVHRETAEKVAEPIQADVAASAEAVLDPSLIDAVFICVPQFARGNLEEIAARKGIHLFVEKPLGLDLEVVRRKEQVIRESGIINSVGYCLRYLDTVQTAKAYLQGRSAHLIQVFRFGGIHPPRWWSQLDMSGGHMVDSVTHQLDMVRFVAGEFREVYAQFSQTSMTRLNPEATIFDAGAVTFTLESGAVGTVTESCVSRLHGGSEVKLFGPDFFVHLYDNGAKLSIVDERHTETHVSKVNPYLAQDRTFIEAVASGKQEGILSSYADGLRSLAATLAPNYSFKERRAVDPNRL